MMRFIYLLTMARSRKMIIQKYGKDFYIQFKDRSDSWFKKVLKETPDIGESIFSFACSMRGGEVGGVQWDRINFEEKTLYIDRVINRVDRKLADSLAKMDVMYRFPNLYPGTRTMIVLKQPKTEGSIRNVYIPETVIQKLANWPLKSVRSKGSPFPMKGCGTKIY